MLSKRSTKRWHHRNIFHTPRLAFTSLSRFFRPSIAQTNPEQKRSPTTSISKEQTIVHQVRPARWQSDPEVEIWPLSHLDYLVPPVLMRIMYVYEIDPQVDLEVVISTLKESLELTLSQCRTMAGTIKEENGEIKIVKRRESSIPFIVQSSERSTSFDALKKAGFPPVELWELRALNEEISSSANGSITGGQSVSEFRAACIPGGLVLTVGLHHLCLDGMGFASFVGQWAKNCIATAQLSEFPAWSPSNLDRQRLNGKVVPLQDGEPTIQRPSVPAPQRGELPAHPVILHFDKFNTEQLKTTASIGEERASSYEAITALLWRALTRARLAIYSPEADEMSVLAQAVDLRSRFNPPLSQQLQANVVTGVVTPPKPINQIVAPGKMPELASLVRQACRSASLQAMLERMDKVAALKDKTSAMWKSVQAPRFMMRMSDGRVVSGYDADFGFGKPIAVRHWNQPGLPCLVQKAPANISPSGTEYVLEVQVPVEISCLSHFLRDFELTQYAEVVSA